MSQGLMVVIEQLGLALGNAADQVAELRAENAQLRAENARLRELVPRGPATP